MKTSLIAALLAGVSFSAMAAELPEQKSNDGLVCTQKYDPNQVVTLHMEVGREITIEVKSDEQIKKVSVSDLDALAAATYSDHANIVWFKPIQPISPEPEVVTTQRSDGSLRIYLFQLDASLPSSGIQQASFEDKSNANKTSKPVPKPCYLVRFTYPGDEAEKQTEAAKSARQAAIARWQQRQAAQKFQQNDPSKDNWKYVAVGNKDLAPDHIYDDGYSTFLQFDGNRAVPGAWEVGTNGKDKLLSGYNSETGPCPAFRTPAATCLKVHAVVAKLRLRDREDLAGNTPSLEIFNREFNAIGDRPGTGTSSQEVRREVKP